MMTHVRRLCTLLLLVLTLGLMPRPWQPATTAGGVSKASVKRMPRPTGPATGPATGPVPWPYHGKRRQANAEEISKWLKELGDRNFKIRESAFKALLEVGQPALKGLAEASVAGDLEVRLRAKQLRERIEVAEALSPTVIQVKLRDAPLPAAVAAIGRQSRLKLELVPQQGPVRQQLQRKKISLDLAAVPFWEALEVLCREGGLIPVLSGQTLQLQLAERGKPYQAPAAHTGPFRMRITGMNYYRNVNLTGGAGQPGGTNLAGSGPQRTESLTVTMDLLTEPHLHIMSMSNPSITEARDELDESVTLGNSNTTTYYGGPQPYYAPGGMQLRQTQFNLRPSTKPSGKLKVLKGTIPVEIIAQRRPLLKVDNIMAGKNRIIKGESGLVLVILQVQDNGGGRSGNIRFFLTGVDNINHNPNMGFNPNLQNELQQRFQLTDAQGNALNLNINLNYNGFNGFNNAGNEKTLEGHMYFNAGPNDGPAARLTYNNNQTIKTAVPFEFHDVPMP